jgi:hypothetical protein
MPVVKNMWSTGWVSDWFYCWVPLHKSKGRDKGIHVLHSQMSILDYLIVARAQLCRK